MVPLYALSCFFALDYPNLSKFIEPFKEIYEAFVIYTFFSLLTLYLGDERSIIIENSGKQPVYHLGFLENILSPVDISDPFSFLAIKRGILQYVWLKPIICILSVINRQVESTRLDVFITTIYNLSVSVSLYELALFWKCLYPDLMKFNPWGKFLCVKLIIFASYWQSIILSILKFAGILGEGDDFKFQNLIMSFELVGFAIGHWYSFSYKEYSSRALPGCSRFQFKTAVKDTLGFFDLIYDFKTTFYGDIYDYRSFDSVESVIAHPTSNSRLARFNDGLRYSGDTKYWLPSSQNKQNLPLLRNNSIVSYSSINGIYSKSIISNPDEESFEENLEEYISNLNYYKQIKKERPFGDQNSPVVYSNEDYTNSPAIQRLRQEAMIRQNI
ncbi:hypothetical protein WICMUC_004742 [Wickerhamomyces mucosus]|uniref:Transmembrane protein n=1 Tax=Wickerhamomyces mucosus TaxID=1378264 RepID=A0A9P8TAD4_9ASCO|nr:hypothetical protein WICMUC_004742 [Wickerhamomyces mucosus]